MKHNELGIKVLSYFYLCLVFFYAFPLLIFSTQLEIFGQTVKPFLTKIVHLSFVIFFYLLYLAIGSARKAGFRIAVVLHFFFLINSLLILGAKTAILEIKGSKVAVYPDQGPVVLFSILINILIITYLLRKTAKKPL